jgi:hypothetical protein
MKSDMLVGGHNGDDVSCNRTAVVPPLAPRTQHPREKPANKTIIYLYPSNQREYANKYTHILQAADGQGAKNLAV